MNNEFKDIKGFEGRYKINKKGQLINVKTGYQLKPYKDKINPNLRFVLRNNKGSSKNVYIYKLVNETFNINITNDDVIKYYQINKHSNTLKSRKKPVSLLLKNGTIKKFNSLNDASKYLGKDGNYLSVYLNKNNNDKFIIVNNNFLGYLTFINNQENKFEEVNTNENLLKKQNSDFNYELPNGFKSIPGYEKLYAINKNGEIKKIKGLSPVETFIIHCEQHANLFKAGKNNTFRIADLVGYTFIQNNSNYKFINKNGDTTNNNVNNLVMEKIIIDNSRAKKKNKLILKDGTIKYFDTLMAASRFLGKSAGYLSFYLANHHTHDIVTAQKGFIGRIEIEK